MPHIHLPEGLPGIASAMTFRPETAKPMSELAEVLLCGPSSLSAAEREMIATFVSARNDCFFCQTSHRAAAAISLGSIMSWWMRFDRNIKPRRSAES
jgi:alkylhydroperoxidase family enzyme